ncbi:MAG: protein kinase [Acidimicrobiales bacterium]
MTLPTEVGSGAVEPAPVAGDRCPQCRAPVAQSWLTCGPCGARLAVPAELPPGATLGADRFVVGRVLGRGGFGITYEVDDSRLRRRVAVKELFPDAAVRHGTLVLSPPEAREAFSAARERFLREARVLARFTHPGIVRVYEVFEEHNTAYLVLELLEGHTLSQVLREREGPFSEAEALDVAERVGSALAAIHRAGLLHRDVSPSNLVVTGHGRTVLIDFGLARSFDADRTAAMTRIVTPGYAPPEQYLGSARFGPPTDVYGLAATLYRLLTRCTPSAAVERQQGTALLPPSRLNTGVSKLVSDAVLDGLELNPQHRPQSIDAFLARLGLAHSPVRPALGSPDHEHTVIEPSPVPKLVVGPAPSTARPPAPAGEPVPPVQPDAWQLQHVRRVPAPGAVVGPPRKGRWMITLPLTTAVVALASAAPVLFVPLLVLLGLPTLATYGDLSVRRAASWAHRRRPGAAPVTRFAANLGLSVLRAVPALCLLAVLVGCWYQVPDRPSLVTASDVFLRLSGVAVGLVLVVPTMRGSSRFATGAGLDGLHHRLVPTGHRPGQGAWILWILCLGLIAAGLAFAPEVWPLPA